MAFPVYPRIIVEVAPNHDAGRPCFSVWALRDTEPDGSAPADASTRPKWSIQIYAVTPQADDPERLCSQAKRIYEETLDRRSGGSRAGYCDRVDIYSLSLPAGVPEEERIARCVAHQKREVATRNATGRSDFFIPPTFDGYYNRIIWIVDAPEEAWGERGGGLLEVKFDLAPKDLTDSSVRADPNWTRIGWGELGNRLREFRSPIQWFNDDYVGSGMIHEELRKYAAIVAETRRYYGTWVGRGVRIGQLLEEGLLGQDLKCAAK